MKFEGFEAMDIRKLDAELAARLQAIQQRNGRDHEAIHSGADQLLAGLLRSLGFESAMNVYDDMERWCA